MDRAHMFVWCFSVSFLELHYTKLMCMFQQSSWSGQYVLQREGTHFAANTTSIRNPTGQWTGAITEMVLVDSPVFVLVASTTRKLEKRTQYTVHNSYKVHLRRLIKALSKMKVQHLQHNNRLALANHIFAQTRFRFHISIRDNPIGSTRLVNIKSVAEEQILQENCLSQRQLRLPTQQNSTKKKIKEGFFFFG